jgi:hypothetical protein
VPSWAAQHQLMKFGRFAAKASSFDVLSVRHFTIGAKWEPTSRPHRTSRSASAAPLPLLKAVWRNASTTPTGKVGGGLAIVRARWCAQSRAASFNGKVGTVLFVRDNECLVFNQFSKEESVVRDLASAFLGLFARRIQVANPSSSRIVFALYLTWKK